GPAAAWRPSRRGASPAAPRSAGEPQRVEIAAARDLRYSPLQSGRTYPGPPMTSTPHTLYLAAPRGFCAGVDRAIDIVDMALQVYGAPIYVRHEIVHNRHVVDDLRHKGAVFVDDLSDVPAGAVVIFSAHGV